MAIIRPSSDIVTGWDVAPGIVTSKQPWRSQPQVPVEVDWNNPPPLIFAPLSSAYGLKTAGLLPVQSVCVNAVPSTSLIGTGYYFDGNGDYISFGDAFYSNTLTIMCSFVAKVVDSNARSLIIKRNINSSASATSEYALTISTLGVGFWAHDSSGTVIINITSSIVPTVNTPYTVVVTADGASSSMYINGALVAIGAQSGVIRDTTNHIEVGVWSGSNASRWFNGSINNVAMWGRSISNGGGLSANPNLIFSPIKRISYFLPPHYDQLNETTADNADYISSATASQVEQIGLSGNTEIGSNKLTYRAASDGDRGLIVRVKQSGSTVATQTPSLTSEPTNFEISFTSTETTSPVLEFEST